MSQNPPGYFPPTYFDAGYWGGEQVEGAISASLSGSSSIAAALGYTQTQVATGGGRKRRSSYAFLDAKPPKQVQARPVFIAATIAGSGAVDAVVIATASMAASASGQAQVSIEPQATASLTASLSGRTDIGAMAAAVDNWALARDEEELWLMAA